MTANTHNHECPDFIAAMSASSASSMGRTMAAYLNDESQDFRVRTGNITDWIDYSWTPPAQSREQHLERMLAEARERLDFWARRVAEIQRLIGMGA